MASSTATPTTVHVVNADGTTRFQTIVRHDGGHAVATFVDGAHGRQHVLVACSGVTSSPTIHCIDGDTGVQRWWGPSLLPVTSLAFTNDTVFMSVIDGTVHACNMEPVNETAAHSGVLEPDAVSWGVAPSLSPPPPLSHV